MKLVIFTLFFTSLLFSQTLSWRGEYDKAHQEALSLHKPLLVFVVKTDDMYTHEVLRTVFTDQPYIKTLNEKVVSVMVSYEGEMAYPVELYYTTRFPALFLVDEKELFLTKPLYAEEITAEHVQSWLKRF